VIVDVFRIQLFGKGCESGKVGEEHGDLFAFAADQAGVVRRIA
jgi:hypothetical protein